LAQRAAAFHDCDGIPSHDESWPAARIIAPMSEALHVIKYPDDPMRRRPARIGADETVRDEVGRRLSHPSACRRLEAKRSKSALANLTGEYRTPLAIGGSIGGTPSAVQQVLAPSCGIK
jgi:hypothetical protein